MKRSTKSEDNKNIFNYAVVQFTNSTEEFEEIEVVNIKWFTKGGKGCRVKCPDIRSWRHELKNNGKPKNDWQTYECRILKGGFGEKFALLHFLNSNHLFV